MIDSIAPKFASDEKKMKGAVRVCRKRGEDSTSEEEAALRKEEGEKVAVEVVKPLEGMNRRRNMRSRNLADTDVYVATTYSSTGSTTQSAAAPIARSTSQTAVRRGPSLRSACCLSGGSRPSCAPSRCRVPPPHKR